MSLCTIKIRTIGEARLFPTTMFTMPPIFFGVVVRSEPVMFVKRVNQNAAKAVVWLTVAMFAIPANPVSACVCAAGPQASDCDCYGQLGLNQSERAQDHCSTKQQHSCCSHSEYVTSTCCISGSSTASLSHGCSCGSSCDCNSGQRPAQPAEILPLREDSLSKVICADSHTGLSAPITPPALRPLVVSSAAPIVLGGSLERCIFLSRFSL